MFVSQRSGDGDIYALDPEDLSVSPLVTTPEGEGGPVFDASRNRIVFQRFGEDRTALYADGERVMRDPNGDAPPSWSADGAWLVYSAKRDANENLYLASVDGSSERRLTDGVFTDRYPVFAPDSRQVAFARNDGFGWDLFVLDIETRSERRLTLDATYVGHPSWSEDGRFLVFDRYYDEQAEIALLDIETGAITRLTDRNGNDLKPVFLPGGERVVFAADASGENEWDLWMVDITSGELTQLTDTPGFDGGPAYAPKSAWRRLLR